MVACETRSSRWGPWRRGQKRTLYCTKRPRPAMLVMLSEPKSPSDFQGRSETLIGPEPATIRTRSSDPMTTRLLSQKGGFDVDSHKEESCSGSLERESQCPKHVARALEWKLRILAGYQVYHRRGTIMLAEVHTFYYLAVSVRSNREKRGKDQRLRCWHAPRHESL